MTTDTMESPIGTDRRLAPALRALLLEALTARELLGAAKYGNASDPEHLPEVREANEMDEAELAERAHDAEVALATYLGARILS